MSTLIKTYESLSSAELEILASVSASGLPSDRPTGVGVLSSGEIETAGGSISVPTELSDPTDILPAIEIEE
jgi:hypothetical protein